MQTLRWEASRFDSELIFVVELSCFLYHIAKKQIVYSAPV